jgi:hypothetical protein
MSAVAAAIELLACGYPARCSVRRCQSRATTVVHVAPTARATTP